MKSSYQLVVIGAGPAGMAATSRAARHGLEVAVFDEQAAPGGQIYRQLGNCPSRVRELMGRDYSAGLPLLQAFDNAAVDYFPGAAVWYLDKKLGLGVTWRGASHRLDAARVVLACGAIERPLPFRGWQLPGVMTAGAAQILIKSAAMVPRRPPVLAGSGPLMLLLAKQLLAAGVGVDAILETTPAANRGRTWRHLPRALAAADYLYKGWQMLAAIRRAGIPYFRGVENLEAEGDERLRAVGFDVAGKRHRRNAEMLLVHDGVIPALQLAEIAGCERDWSEAQQSWRLRVDRWGETSQTGIFAVGDGAAIGGAQVAAQSGELAGLQLAAQFGRIDRRRRDRLAQPLRWARARHLAIRPWLDAYYRTADTEPSDDTLICRCEEISAARLRDAISRGCAGPNQVKAFTRCGMGPCQGRLCAPTLEAICAEGQTKQRERVTQRPPARPVTLGQLAASLENDND